MFAAEATVYALRQKYLRRDAVAMHCALNGTQTWLREFRRHFYETQVRTMLLLESCLAPNLAKQGCQGTVRHNVKFFFELLPENGCLTVTQVADRGACFVLNGRGKIL